MRHILFLCTANSARSQMAEALLRSKGDARIAVSSAGTHPAAGVHPMALEVMAERGIEMAGARPKVIAADTLPDVIVTVCDSARDACPHVPGASQVHWGLPDPAAVAGGDDAMRAAFRRTAEALDTALTGMLDLPIETLSAEELVSALEAIAPLSPAAE